VFFQLWMRHGSKCARCTISTHQNCKLNSPPSSIECRRLVSGDVGGESEAGPSSAGLSSWLNLNATLSPRFTAFGPSSAKSTTIIHQHLANGKASGQLQQISGKNMENTNIRYVYKEMRDN
jgi:hypothetical protein